MRFVGELQADSRVVGRHIERLHVCAHLPRGRAARLDMQPQLVAMTALDTQLTRAHIEFQLALAGESPVNREVLSILCVPALGDVVAGIGRIAAVVVLRVHDRCHAAQHQQQPTPSRKSNRHLRLPALSAAELLCCHTADRADGFRKSPPGATRATMGRRHPPLSSSLLKRTQTIRPRCP